ncbi:MAG: hypothetical protein HWE21_02510 [Cytophagia bacterium]|nr:hypothetical protein [Cytophagia bacterium]
MKINNKYILAVLVAIFAAVSCTDEDSFRNEVFFKLERGGFVRFVDAFNPLIGTSDPATFVYDAAIEDVNGNLSAYNLYVIDNGDTFLVNSFTELTGEVSINITAQNVATAIGGSTADFEFGQTLSFIGEAIRDDGVVFDTAPLDADFDDNEFGGTTQPNLYTDGYRNAMLFDLTIACPSPPDASTYAGTYDFIQNGWLGTTSGTVEVVAGPGDNQITLIDAQTRRGATGAKDFIITLNADQTTTAETQEMYVHGTYGQTTLSGSGFTFECAGHRIIITTTQRVSAGSFGSSTTIIEKQ